jgi:Rod binding domain-containing protein
MSYGTIITPYSGQLLTPVNALQGSQNAPDAEKAKQEAVIDSTAKDFEAVFLTSYFGKGSAGEIYKSFLMNEYGKSVANAGGIGIADTVKQELLRLQEVPV